VHQCQKLFLQLAYEREDNISWKEFDTILNTFFPVCLYQSGDHVLAVYPGVSKEKN
jgi:hypothetical protein